jgi:hypothetical protein
MTRLELRSGRHLGDNNALFCNLRLQAAIFGRIDDIDAAGDDRDGSCRQRARIPGAPIMLTIGGALSMCANSGG